MLHSHADQWATRFPKGVANIARLIETRVVPAIYRGRPFVAISRSTAAALHDIGIPESETTVIECGVDVPESTGTKSQAPLFVALARLVPHKRIELLIRAWRSVQPVVGGRFVIVGDGPQLASLQREAASVPGVEFAGRVTDAERTRLLEDAWLLVNGSHHEGWGLAIMEAAAVGTPAIAVDVPGIRDAVQKDTTGVLVDAIAPNLADEIARVWIGLAEDAARRTKMGVAARIWARQNGWDRMVDSWEGVLQEAVNAARHPR
jgi:glycosyltransferase involved in cell wall biosynthesis